MSIHMTTSGTVGRTQLDVATIVEHACRRAGIPAADQTAETADIAINSLFMLMLQLSTQGLQLWCLEQQMIPLRLGLTQYELGVGVQDLATDPRLRRLLSAEVQSFSSDASSYTVVFASELLVRYVVVEFADELHIYAPVVEAWDGAAWVTVATLEESVRDGEEWVEIREPIYASQVRVRDTAATAAALSIRKVAESAQDIPLYRMSRDAYMVLPNKASLGSVTQCYLDRQRDSPILRVWQAPSADMVANCALSVDQRRQVQDITGLGQTLDAPSRWLEHLTWALGQRIASEHPKGNPERAKYCLDMADKTFPSVQSEETDSADSTLRPRISGYTR